MSSKIGSPPPYESEHGYNGVAQPAYSYYADDEIQHFYKWNSPPGIIKIMSCISIILCVGIFACVASTLAHDNSIAMSGMGGGYGGGGIGGGYGGGYGGTGYNNYGGGGFGGGGYNTGMYGGMNYYNDPRKGKGFMLAMAIICFLALLAVFIMVISHQRMAKGRKFYLAVIIMSAILAFLMLVATIVYLVAVNPMAQSSGSMQYNQIQAMCAPYRQPQQSGVFVNQYLYHYCVVEPQEAIAIVLGFVVTAALIIITVFAVKTRQKINNYGKDNILWRRVKVIEVDAPDGDVEAWVNDVSAAPEPPAADYPLKSISGSRNHLDDASDYKPPYSYSPAVVEDSLRSSAIPYSNASERPSSNGRPKKRRTPRTRTDGYDTDGYMSSGDELDDEDFSSEFPRIEYEHERDEYKRVFDDDHLEYKELQAELDAINKKMAEVDRELDDLPEGSPQFLDAMDEYKDLKNKKKSPDYQMKKKRCKYLKSKLSHIKKMVSDFDRRG